MLAVFTTMAILWGAYELWPPLGMIVFFIVILFLTVQYQNGKE